MLTNFYKRGLFFDGDGAGAGASGSGNGDGSGGNAGGSGANDNGQTVTFKQSELDAKFAERAKRAAEGATAELLKALGVKDAEEAKSFLAKAKELETANLSELEKAKKAAADATAEAERQRTAAEKAVADAQTIRIRAAVETLAAQMGFHKPEDAYQLANVAEIKIGDDGKVVGVSEALDALKKERPYLLKGENAKATDTDATKRSQAKAKTDEEKREIAARLGVRPEFIN